MLARLLHLSGVSVTVFESDASPDYRSQGGSLDLHETTGLAAIRAAGLWDRFEKHARYDGESMMIMDRNLKTWFKLDGSRNPYPKPEIDRTELRRILFESLPEGTIKWNRRLQSVDKDNLLVFQDGTESGYDLVIGADGAWSKVRMALTDIKPEYTGIGGYQMRIPDAKNTAPEVYELLNRGTIFAFEEGKELALQQLGDGEICVNFWTVRDEEWIKTANPKEARSTIFKQIEPWNQLFHGAISKATAACTPRNLYMLPVGAKWEHKPGLTLLGDAAHLMMHCAGEGVNLAFKDALTLSKAISDSIKEQGASNLDQSIKEYESAMFIYATRAQKMTDQMKDLNYYTPDAPRAKMADWILTRAKYDIPPAVYPFAAVWFHCFYFVFKLFN